MTNFDDAKLAHFRMVREKMERAEAFIIAEAEKMGIALDRNQAATFASIVLKVYEIA